MKRIYDFSSFSSINEDNPPGATGATGAAPAGGTGAEEKTPKSYKEEKWYSYLEAIVNGVVSESYMPMVQLATGYDIDPDFASINAAKTLEEKATAFEKILSNAAGALDPKDIGYEELKKISQEYLNVGKKYITALPVLKEKSGTKGNEISDSINSLMDLLMKKIKENKPKK
jgi:hypothetical protein